MRRARAFQAAHISKLYSAGQRVVRRAGHQKSNASSFITTAFRRFSQQRFSSWLPSHSEQPISFRHADITLLCYHYTESLSDDAFELTAFSRFSAISFDFAAPARLEAP